MKTVIKHIVSFALIFAMIMTTSAAAFASEDYDLSVSEELGVRTVTTSDGESEYTVVYDSNLSTIQVSRKDLLTNEVFEGDVQNTDTTTLAPIAPFASNVIHQDTFSNYEYDVNTKTGEWNLERPNPDGGQFYFKTYQNSSNEAKLTAFFDKVNDLNGKELDAVLKYGLAIVTTCAAGFISGMAVASGGALTAAAIGAIVAAAGATGNAAVALAGVGTACNACLYAYNNAKNASSGNIHY